MKSYENLCILWLWAIQALKICKLWVFNENFQRFFFHTPAPIWHFYTSIYPEENFKAILTPSPSKLLTLVIRWRMYLIISFQITDLTTHHDKVKSVKEAFIRCLAVHTLKFEILKPARKTKQKTLDALVFSLSKIS